MTYVPGFQHDVFVSYAHGDHRDWLNRLVDRLEPALAQRLGMKASIWIDNDDLRKSRDFSKEIPDSVRSSAAFLFFPSPSYIRSPYCVDQECKAFEDTIPGKRARFTAEGFANELFALRCPILPVDGNEHWSLFSGLTDIAFCDESDTLTFDTREFETSFRRLTGELAGLLKRMRNHSTSVFLYPSRPAPDLERTHAALVAELSAHNYRLVPDRAVNLADQLRDASMSVFLLGKDYDDTTRELVDRATETGKPWVVWCSPSIESASENQLGFWAHVEQLDSAAKTYLDTGTLPGKLKEEVLGLLRPDPRVRTDTEGKPSVYLVYNDRERADKKSASLISYHFREQFHFEHPNDPAQHTLRLSRSDGVLLVWGNADEEWCSREFAEIQTVRRTGAHGLCLFDPKEPKTGAVQEIRKVLGQVYIGEQFGKFDPARLVPFFTPLLRRTQGPA